MEKKSLANILKTIGTLAVFTTFVISAAYVLSRPHVELLTDYTKARMTLDSAYSAQKEHFLDSLDTWHAAQADSLKAKYNIGR